MGSTISATPPAPGHPSSEIDSLQADGVLNTEPASKEI